MEFTHSPLTLLHLDQISIEFTHSPLTLLHSEWQKLHRVYTFTFNPIALRMAKTP